jgi:hypothetical protein
MTFPPGQPSVATSASGAISACWNRLAMPDERVVGATLAAMRNRAPWSSITTLSRRRKTGPRAHDRGNKVNGRKGIWQSKLGRIVVVEVPTTNALAADARFRVARWAKAKVQRIHPTWLDADTGRPSQDGPAKAPLVRRGNCREKPPSALAAQPRRWTADRTFISSPKRRGPNKDCEKS